MQLDLAGPLGPADGRYLIRAPGGGGDPEAVVALRTHGRVQEPPGPASRLVRRRAPRARGVGPPEAAAVRVTVIRPEPVEGSEEAGDRLSALRSDREALDAEVEWAVTMLNRLLRAHRAAAADPSAPEASAARALAVRAGYGTGDEVAQGKFTEAVEVPPPARSRRREALVPEDRLAAILSGHAPDLASVELVMRARLDLDAGRPREAALQARIALEALLAELGPEAAGADARAALEDDRQAVAAAAGEALAGDPPTESQEAVAAAVERMEVALRRQQAKRREEDLQAGEAGA